MSIGSIGLDCENSQITNSQNTDKLTTPSSPGAWFWTGAATKTKQRWRLTEISYLFVIAVLKIDEQSTEQWNKSHSGVIFGCGDVRLLKARWCKCCIVRVSSVELQSVPCHFALLFPSFIVRRFLARGQHFGQWEISKLGVSLLSKPAITDPFRNLPFRKIPISVSQFVDENWMPYSLAALEDQIYNI